MKKPKKITREQFVGAQMANMLYAIAHNQRIDQRTREDAEKLYWRWDSFATFQLHNPIVAAELEARLFPKGKQ